MKKPPKAYVIQKSMKILRLRRLRGSAQDDIYHKIVILSGGEAGVEESAL